ncbi:hypothetical protein AAE478_000535 [Parahypoxylon ruwenzoriense]
MPPSPPPPVHNRDAAGADPVDVVRGAHPSPGLHQYWHVVRLAKVYSSWPHRPPRCPLIQHRRRVSQHIPTSVLQVVNNQVGKGGCVLGRSSPLFIGVGAGFEVGSGRSPDGSAENGCGEERQGKERDGFHFVWNFYSRLEAGWLSLDLLGA